MAFSSGTATTRVAVTMIVNQSKTDQPESLNVAGSVWLNCALSSGWDPIKGINDRTCAVRKSANCWDSNALSTSANSGGPSSTSTFNGVSTVCAVLSEATTCPSTTDGINSVEPEAVNWTIHLCSTPPAF